MDDDFFSDETFESLLTISKKSPVNFGFALGKKAEDSILVFHKTKKGDDLARKAKKVDGVGPKTACGTATAKGRLVTLNCEEYCRGMKKALKAAFKKKGMPLKFNLVVPSGVEVDPDDLVQETDDETLPDGTKAESKPPDAVPEPPPPPPIDDLVKKQLLQALAKIKPSYEQALKSPTIAEPLKTQLRDLMAKLVTEVQAVHADQARALIAQIVPLVKAPAAAKPSAAVPESQPEAKDPTEELNARLKKLKPVVEKAIAAAPARRGELLASIGQIQGEIKSKEFEQADSSLVALEKLAKGLLGPKQPVPPAAEDADWKKAKENLEDAMNVVGAQVQNLAAFLADVEIEQVPPELIADLRDIARFGLPALTRNLRTPLVAAMLDVERSSGEKRSELAGVGLKRVTDFLNHLASDSAIAAVDSNCFGVRVTMRSTLEPPLKALGEEFERIAESA
jgi:hypothetical protein